MIKHRCLLVLLGTILLIFSSCKVGKNERVLKLAHGLDITHPVHKGMEYLAEKLDEKSRGHIRIDIYPGGQLGNERELIELLQIGSLAMTKVSAAPMESFVPEMKIFGIPYLFRNSDHFWKVLQSDLGRELLLKGEPYFLRGLCYFDAGSRSFYTRNTPIRTPADLKGLKIRVMKSITAVKMVRSLGGSATPISWGELYTSLQQGVIDGAENNLPSFYLSHHYEVCKYYSVDQHTAIPDILLISTKVWNKLSSREQNWLEEAVAEAVPFQRKLWREAGREAMRKIREAKVQVIYPDKGPFLHKTEALYKSYKNTPMGELIEEIKKIK